MHGGARVGLGEHQQLRLARARAHLRRQRGEARRHASRLRARAACRGRCPARSRSTSSPPSCRQLVVAVAEEGEVVVGQPAQERAAPRRLARRSTGGAVASSSLTIASHALPHRLPVLDRGAHVGEHALDAVARAARSCRRVDLAVDLDVDQRLARPPSPSARRELDQLALRRRAARADRVDRSGAA